MDKTDLLQAYKDFLATKPDDQTLALQACVAAAIKDGFAPFLVTSFGVDVFVEEDVDMFIAAFYILNVEVRRLNYRFKTRISRNDIWNSDFYKTWYDLGADLKHQVRYRAGLDVPNNIERGEN